MITLCVVQYTVSVTEHGWTIKGNSVCVVQYTVSVTEHGWTIKGNSLCYSDALTDILSDLNAPTGWWYLLTVSRKRNQNEISLEKKKTHQGED